ncbi:hypothetical protein HDU96_000232 [Phlyctochytrium bullatum]|nr:hypothetical protein HDU96_000232 [Phlyctochytrium bullatum]
MGAETDKRAGGATGAVEKNAIFFDRIQAETIKKELRVHRLHLETADALRTLFPLDLVITNKPNTSNVQAKDEVEDEEYLAFSKKTALTPKEKLPLPVTSSQVYGWDPEPLFRTTDPRFYHPRHESEITKMYGQAFGSKR